MLSYSKNIVLKGFTSMDIGRRAEPHYPCTSTHSLLSLLHILHIILCLFAIILTLASEFYYSILTILITYYALVSPLIREISDINLFELIEIFLGSRL